MAEYSIIEKRVYSNLEPSQNEYSTPEDDVDHDAPRKDSDNGSLSGRSDHGSAGHRNEDGRHDDEHGVRDREGDRSDREDGRSDREDGRSDREDGESDREGDRKDGHSVRDGEGSLRDGDGVLRDQHDDSPRDRDVDGLHGNADNVYEDADDANVYDELMAQADAQQEYYNRKEQDGKSDDGHSDGEEGHGVTVTSDAVKVARADVYDEGVYDELGHHSGSEGSEKGEHASGQDRVSDDVYDDLEIRDEHTRERRGSHDSDEGGRRKLSDDEGIKRQASSSSTASASSGKFMLRTSRKADALHVLRRMRDPSSTDDDNPEMDELVTILRSTDREFVDDDTLDEAKRKEKIKSFITSKLIHKFEQGIASEEAFNELHGDDNIAESSHISESHNTTVVKTTVVKTTVKAEATSPVSPKSPPASDVTTEISRSSSSSSMSSSSQVQQKSVTYNSQLSKSSTNGQGQQTNFSRQPSNEQPKSPDEASVPGWKAEIEMRKKTKSHVPTQKPKEPMKMSEVPEWKKQLQEKNKMKKVSSSDETDLTLAKVTTVEMGRIKHEMVISHGGRGDIPEWARLADEKKKTTSH